MVHKYILFVRTDPRDDGVGVENELKKTSTFLNGFKDGPAGRLITESTGIQNLHDPLKLFGRIWKLGAIERPRQRLKHYLVA